MLLWVGDWIWRLRQLLRKAELVRVDNAGGGWYRVRLPQLHGASITNLEKELPARQYAGPLWQRITSTSRL